MTTEQERILERRREALKLVRERELKDLREVLSTPAGRRVFWRLLGEAGIFRSMASLIPDANRILYHEGRREMGLFILAELEAADRNLFPKMQREAVAEQIKLQKEFENEQRELAALSEAAEWRPKYEED